jgi:hypothetical protein
MIENEIRTKQVNSFISLLNKNDREYGQTNEVSFKVNRSLKSVIARGMVRIAKPFLNVAMPDRIFEDLEPASKLDSWDFDVLSYSPDEKIRMIWSVF